MNLHNNEQKSEANKLAELNQSYYKDHVASMLEFIEYNLLHDEVLITEVNSSSDEDGLTLNIKYQPSLSCKQKEIKKDFGIGTFRGIMQEKVLEPISTNIPQPAPKSPIDYEAEKNKYYGSID